MSGEMMRMKNREAIVTDKITNALHIDNICPSCGRKTLDYVDDPDLMASEYTQVLCCMSCGDEVSFYGQVIWHGIEVSESDETSTLSINGNNKADMKKKAQEMQEHMREIRHELQSYVMSHADCYDRLDYEPLNADDLMDENTFLMISQLVPHADEDGLIDEATRKDFRLRRLKFGKGGSHERAMTVDRFYELAHGYHEQRARGHYWIPDLMSAYIELAVEMGASMPTELFTEHIWFYIANEGELDEHWLEDRERMRVLEHHVLPLARFLLDRDTQYAYEILAPYPTKIERLMSYTEKIRAVVDNLVKGLRFTEAIINHGNPLEGKVMEWEK